MTVGICPANRRRTGHLAPVEILFQPPPKPNAVAEELAGIGAVDDLRAEPADLLAEDELLSGLHAIGQVLTGAAAIRPSEHLDSPAIDGRERRHLFSSCQCQVR